MDPSFRSMPLEGEGDDCINQPEDCPNTKEGIDQCYRHWSIPNNVSGKMKIVTKLSLVQLKLTLGSFLTYLRRRGVHMNYAQFGVFDTVALGWVTGAHPSFSYRENNQLKKRVKITSLWTPLRRHQQSAATAVNHGNRQVLTT
jgi:hypothetical protein